MLTGYASQLGPAMFRALPVLSVAPDDQQNRELTAFLSRGCGGIVKAGISNSALAFARRGPFSRGHGGIVKDKPTSKGRTARSPDRIDLQKR
jgi:hypothetical protein